MNAAKEKSLSPLTLTSVRILLLLVVTLFLPQTRVWGFAAPPQPASGQIASPSASAVVGNCDAWLYDASDSLVAAESGVGSVTPDKPAAPTTENNLLTLGAGDGWGNPATLEKHFLDHGADFGATSADGYARQKGQVGMHAWQKGQVGMHAWQKGQVCMAKGTVHGKRDRSGCMAQRRMPLHLPVGRS
jgi:hypothetical protein